MRTVQLYILHLSSEKSWGGGEQQIAYLLENMPDQRVKQIVVCRKGSAFEHYCMENKVVHYAIKMRGSLDLSSSITVKNIYIENEIDIIHVHSSNSHSIAVLASILGANANIVLSRRNAFPVKNNFYTKWKYNHHSIKRIVCVSKAVQTEVLKVVRNQHLSKVVYDGVDVRRIKYNKASLPSVLNQSKEKKFFLVGTTSTVSQNKDPYTFIKVAQKVIQTFPKVHFIWFGDGPELENAKFYVEQLNLQDNVFFEGFIPNVWLYIHAFDVFLFTTKSEGLGSSVLDSFAANVPVIASNVGGIPEMIADHISGILCKPGDVESFASAIMEIIKNPKLKDILRMNARKQLDFFNVDSMAESMLNVYREVCEHNITQ